MTQNIWSGIDIGKSAHHCIVMDDAGKQLLSRRVPNTEADLNVLIDDVLGLGDGTVAWATDLNRGPASLLLTLLHNRRQRVIYLAGRRFHHAAELYRGEVKSDAKDAAVLADHARSSLDPHYMPPADTAARHLKVLTARRSMLSEDRVRAINRLRGLLTESFPALDATFQFARSAAAVRLVSQYQTPTAIREAGAASIEAWLQSQGSRCSRKIADAAVEAAHKQTVQIPGEQLTGVIIGQIADDILLLDAAIAQVERSVDAILRRHRYTPIVSSMPGFGPVLTGEFLAQTGGNMQNYRSANHLASCSGVSPVSKDSGNIMGNNRRPRHYDRRLLRVWYMSSTTAVKVDERSRIYYDRKRAEGKSHTQAILSLSRRRVNVMWAMLRDNAPYRQLAPKDPGTQ
ncbi:IS110 family RNA-guided transposase [Nocardia asteroides]|uniref:IS110 family transposase n=1 Tax=Nocardia asteroides TaxID=1824 RepID=UPI003656D66F